MFLILLYIIQCLLKLVFYLTIFLLASIIGLKLWLQPFTGVCKCKNVELKGKVALITGGNSGIGRETATDLARRGATVIIASRDTKKSEEAVKDIIASTGNNNVFYKSLNLAKFSSIREFAADFNKSYDRLDILVNNAGCAGLKPVLTEYGVEKVTQINYVGPFLLTNLLLDKIVDSKPSRIVVVSSKANQYHDFNPDDITAVKTGDSLLGWKIYANSKLCQVLWTKALAKRLPQGVTVNALHPGVVKTDIFNKLQGWWKVVALWIIDVLFKTAEEGAQTSIHLCVSPELDDVTGEYFAECQIAAPAKLAEDDKVVEKVWESTLELIKEK